MVARALGAHCCSLVVAIVCLAPAAQAASPHRARAAPVSYAATFALGALGGFLAHESAHLSMNAALGNTPRFRAIDGLFHIPFVAISPDISCHRGRCVGAAGQPFGAGARGRAAIASAGFVMQLLSSEIILSHMPDALYRPAPLLQGWLALNVALAIAYAVTCIAGIESEFGDASGLALHGRLPRELTATLVATPALLDATRALFPQARWLPWAARLSKLAFVGIVAWR